MNSCLRTVLHMAVVCACFGLLGVFGGAEAHATDGRAHAFDPQMQTQLPDSRLADGNDAKLLQQMGVRQQSLQHEAAHRPYWRSEVYPVVFGQAGAPQEILVVLDFASPESLKVWAAVVQASRTISPSACKIAVFGKCSESYGTDLLGLAIWLARSRPGQAMPYLTYALERWNAVKQGQRRQGNEKRFVKAYDATLSPKDFPIHYAWFSRLRPPVPAGQELALSRYCYDAGNVNMYQAVQVIRYYGVKKLPAVIVNGRVLDAVTAQAISNAVR